MRPTLVQIVLASFGALLLAAAVLSVAQPGADFGRFEFDVLQTFEGVFRSEPVPALWVLRRQDQGAFSNYSVYPLVGPGFRGLSQAAVRFDDVPVTLSGKLIYRGTLTVIEADEGSLQRISRVVEFPDPAPPIVLGSVALRGQILDIKSHAGYQEPGIGSWLIGPSSNAVQGGVPPVLVMRNRNGDERIALLVNQEGRSLGRDALGRLGTPVEVKGDLVSSGGMLMLKTPPDAIRRLWPWE